MKSTPNRAIDEDQRRASLPWIRAHNLMLMQTHLVAEMIKRNQELIDQLDRTLKTGRAA